MGLDTSHGCWHGAYSAFHRWRAGVAKAAGLPPLCIMEGHAEVSGTFDSDDIKEIEKSIDKEVLWDSNKQVFHAMNIIRNFSYENFDMPLSWDYFKDDPLTALMCHSDCDGYLEAEICGPLADRLEEILPKLPEGDGGGHIGCWREKTQEFIDGLRLAAELGEKVEFR